MMALPIPSDSVIPIVLQSRIEMQDRRGLTLIELMVVLAIIAIALSLLLPAVQSSRDRAREAACQNNLRQIYFALSQFLETNKKLPPRPVQGEFGGWMIAILPFMEQGNLKNEISIGRSISDSTEFNRPPTIYICPVRRGIQDISEGMWPAHYVVATDGYRKGASVYDAPVNVRLPWGSSPEMDPIEIRASAGPHHGGFYFMQNDLHGVESTLAK